MPFKHSTRAIFRGLSMTVFSSSIKDTTFIGNTVSYSTAWNYGTICRDFASVEPQFWSAVSPRENRV